MHRGARFAIGAVVGAAAGGLTGAALAFFRKKRASKLGVGQGPDTQGLVVSVAENAAAFPGVVNLDWGIPAIVGALTVGTAAALPGGG